MHFFCLPLLQICLFSLFLLCGHKQVLSLSRNTFFLLSPQTSTHNMLKPRKLYRKLPFDFLLFVYASNPLLTLCCRSNLIPSYVPWTFLLPASPILSLSPMCPPMPNNSWTHPPSSLLSISALLLLLLLLLLFSFWLSPGVSLSSLADREHAWLTRLVMRLLMQMASTALFYSLSLTHKRSMQKHTHRPLFPSAGDPQHSWVKQ